MVSCKASFLVMMTLLGVCQSAGAIDPGPRISQLGHTAWRLQDGVFAGTPVAITQTADGYLWVGTSAGLVRFDGVRFLPFAPDGQELESPTIFSLLGASDGSLWIGTGVGLARWQAGKLTSYGDTARGLIDSIREQKDGSIWMTRSRTQDGRGPLCTVAESTIHCFGSADGIPYRDGRGLVFQSPDVLWMNSAAALTERSQSGFKTYGLPAAEIDAQIVGITSLAAAADGSLWVGMRQTGAGMGLQQFKDGNWKSFSMSGLDGSSLSVCTLLLDRHGSLWVGTEDAGLYRITESRVDHFSDADGLSSNTVQGLFEDREGDLWVATTQGIDRFRDLRVISLSTHEGLSSNNVAAVVASHNGVIWLSNARALDIVRGDEVSSVSRSSGLPGREITSLLEDSSGNLWAGIDDGIYVRSKDKWIAIDKWHGEAIGTVLAMAEDTQGNIWAQTIGPSRLYRIENLKIEQVLSTTRDPKTPLAMPEANVIAADPGGGLWLGLRAVLARFRDGKLERFPFFEGSHSALIDSLSVRPDGSVLGVTSMGLVGWRNGKLRTMTVKNGLPCRAIRSLIFDAKNYLWLYTQCGIVRIADSELQRWWEQDDARIQSTVLNALDGAFSGRSPFRPTAALARDGRIWFVNGNIVQIVDPDNGNSNNLPPPVHVEQVSANGHRYEMDKTTFLPALPTNIQIDYTALSLPIPERVRFRYRLDGFDKDWQDAGNRRAAFYSGLAPGRYRFHVIASNNDGVWSEMGAAQDIAVPAAWFQAIWFRVLCTCIALALLWLLYRVRIRQVRAHTRRLVEARLAERERIARDLHDSILQGFQGLMFRLQAVRHLLPGRPGDAATSLDSALQSGDQAIFEGRDAVENLRSASFEDGDLTSSLRRLGAELGIEIEHHPAPHYGLLIEGAPRQLTAVVRDEGYRIVREATRNAYRHAQAQHIEVEVTFADAELRIRVRDDGVGIDPQILAHGQKPGHWGLPGMRERVKTLGGDLKVSSEGNAGTEIELRIPADFAYSEPRNSAFRDLFRSPG
ncbi:MAG TPA: two-component regulator propeller domain-containing protein [Steroidobacteraceae bacterium]|jgi:signal transduction histidine kinase/ligand-binding sensor domain-containing protein